MHDVKERVSGPATALFATGIVLVAYLVLYVAWSALSVILGGVGLIFQLISMADGADAFIPAALGAWGLVVDIIQALGFVVLLFPAALVILGGRRLAALDSRSSVVAGATAAALVPLFSVVIGLGSCLAFDVCGFVCGLVPSVVMLILGAGVGVWVFTVVQDPDIADAFET